MHRIDLLAVLERDQDVVHQRNRQVRWHQRRGGRRQRERETGGELFAVGVGEAPQPQQHPGRGHRLHFAAAHRAVFAALRQRRLARRTQRELIDAGITHGRTLRRQTARLLQFEQCHQAQRVDVLCQREAPDGQPAVLVVQRQCADSAVVAVPQAQPVSRRVIQSPAVPWRVSGIAGCLAPQQPTIRQHQAPVGIVQLWRQVNQQRSERVLVGLERHSPRIHGDGQRGIKVLNRMGMLHVKVASLTERMAWPSNRARDSRRVARLQNTSPKT